VEWTNLTEPMRTAAQFLQPYSQKHGAFLLDENSFYAAAPDESPAAPFIPGNQEHIGICMSLS
jgi:hypothetical protein